MRRMSALGWVARTVLMSGSSTGLVPVPRWAPRRASRRRTPTPGVPPPGGTGSEAWPGRAAALVRWARAVPRADGGEGIEGTEGVTGSEVSSSARSPGTSAGTAASAAAASWVERSSVPGCASARAASVASVPVVVTSPATRAPHICQAISVLGGVKRQIRSAGFPAGGPDSGLDGEKGADGKAGQLGPAVKEGELEEHGQADHLGTGLPDQLGGRPGGAAGGQHVVDDQHAF